MPRVQVGSGRTLEPEMLDRIIDDIAGEIDFLLDSLGATVPITTPTFFFNFLRGLNADGATATALKAVFPEATTLGRLQTTFAESPAYVYYWKRYTDGLKLLQERGLPTALSTRREFATYFTRHPEEEAILGELAGDHMFTVGKDW